MPYKCICIAFDYVQKASRLINVLSVAAVYRSLVTKLVDVFITVRLLSVYAAPIVLTATPLFTEITYRYLKYRSTLYCMLLLKHFSGCSPCLLIFTDN